MEDAAKSTKLIINLRDGIVQVEGDESFVRDVYNDFKERVSKPVIINLPPAAQIEQQLHDEEDAPEARLPAPAETPRKTRARRASSATNGTPRGETANYKPKLNSALDLTGLTEFYDKYEATTHSEKILIFATFLRDTSKIEPFTADDIFTCYAFLQSRTKAPGAFLQAFRDTQNVKRFIEYKSPTDIRLTIVGTNYLNFDMKKKA